MNLGLLQYLIQSRLKDYNLRFMSSLPSTQHQVDVCHHNGEQGRLLSSLELTQLHSRAQRTHSGHVLGESADNTTLPDAWHH